MGKGKYEEFTNDELADSLDKVEKRFTGLLEDAEKHFDKYSSIDKSLNKSETILAFVKDTIERTLNDFAILFGKKPEASLVSNKENVIDLESIKRQTPEICLTAIKQNPNALIYVKEQTPEICLTAVKQNPQALQWVNKQTLDICLEAVGRDAVYSKIKM